MANNPEHESSEEHGPCPGPGGGVGVVAEILPVAEILLVALGTSVPISISMLGDIVIITYCEPFFTTLHSKVNILLTSHTQNLP